MLNFQIVVNSLLAAGLVHSYLALSKIKEALYAAREAMKAMPQSAKALKLVGDVHASNSGGREKVHVLKDLSHSDSDLEITFSKWISYVDMA